MHVAFKDFIVKCFGTSAWSAILQQAGIDDDNTILRMEQYDDSLTFATVGIACKVLNTPVPTALELFGSHFVGFAVAAGHDGHIKSLGTNLFDLLCNLNILHHDLERDFRSAIFPVFTVESETESGDIFKLSYRTCRIGLAPLLRGILTRVASELYDADLRIEVLKSPDSEDAPRRMRESEDTEVVWRMHVSGRSKELSKKVPQKLSAATFSFFDLHAAWASCCRTDQIENPEIVVSSPCLLLEVLEGDRLTAARHLFRGVAAEKVASPWLSTVSLHQVSNFWSAYIKLDKYYDWSAPMAAGRRNSYAMESEVCRRVPMWFLSHAWSQPDDWIACMGKECSYSSVKATEICGVAKDLAAIHLNNHDKWRDVHFWVDKCCIPQGHCELMCLCVSLIEEFIMLCDGLVVIMTWSYFERLWCVYEWVCFLLHRDTSSVILCASAFVRSRTLPLLITSIKHFSLENCKCQVESDRQALYKKVDAHYKNRKGFELFLKFTAIALIARDMATSRTSSGAEAIAPWIQLAKDCGFDRLARRLSTLAGLLSAWRMKASTGTNLDVQSAILKKTQAWFQEHIDPLIKIKRFSVVKATTWESEFSSMDPVGFRHQSGF